MRTLLRSAGALVTAGLVFGPCWGDQSTGQENGTKNFGTTVVIPSGLRGLVYDLYPGQQWLPDFSRMKPVGAIYTTSLNVPLQEWSFGFPGVTRRFEWFAIDYTGRFWIDMPGQYEFSLTSDDGSKLYIDEKMLINLDGMHSVLTDYGRIKLDCGIHSIRVSYFQGPRYHLALVLSVAGGRNKKLRIFSTEEFKPPENPEDWVCAGVPVSFDPNRRTLPDVQTQRTTAAFEAEALGILNANPRPHELAVRSAVFHFWGSAAGTEISIVAGIPGTGVSSTLIAGSVLVHRLHVALLALVKADNGRVVEKFSIDAPYEIPGRDYATVRTQDIVFSHPVHLPAGRYTVETAVMDREGGHAGTAEVAVETAPQRSGIGLSSLVPVDRVEPASATADAADPLIFGGKRVVPRLAPGVNSKEEPVVYFVVYPNSSNSAKPMLRVEYLNAGRTIAEKTTELPPANASGAIPMYVTVAPPPGDSALKITVFQGGDSASDTLNYQSPAK